MNLVRDGRLTAQEIINRLCQRLAPACWLLGMCLLLTSGATASDQHWAFAPPQRPEPPPVLDRQWVRNSIDAFVLDRLEQDDLRPSTPAAASALLRRLSLDLIGLPPTLAELDEWMRESPGDEDYLAQVDRLLDSPHFGERWARVWLDAARYADSDGFEKDKPREVWSYRDWVIRALNDDLPYDQFIIEQVAGDMLSGATQDQIVATGFLRNSMLNEEGSVDPEEFRMVAMFDRMDAVGKSILGVTTQCSQCHDHKYDPLTQREYYEMFAFLNNSYEAQATVYTREQQTGRQEVLNAIRGIEQQLQAERPDWKSGIAAWEAEVEAEFQPEWQVVELEFNTYVTGGQTLYQLEDGSYLAQGYAPVNARWQVDTTTSLQRVTGIRLELLTHPNLPHGGPGRSVLGTGALSDITIEAAPADDPESFVKHEIAEATADLEPAQAPLKKIFDNKKDEERLIGPASFAIDDSEKTAWGTDIGPGRRNQPSKLVFQLKQPIAQANAQTIRLHLRQFHGGWNSDDNQTHIFGRIRLSVTDAPIPKIDPIPQVVHDVLATIPEHRTATQRQTLFSYWRTTVPEWIAANEQIEQLWQQHPAGTTQLVYHERDTPRATHRLNRGEFLQPEEMVTPGVPAFLHPLPEGTERTRLAFARWLVDSASPTTARAIVNRIWQSYFGVGLVSTSDDLGIQGDAPSHPRLLDWLATELMQEGWSLKHIHRLIVMSSTYRQSSRAAAEQYAADPQNRLLARGPRFRVDAETVRDIALAASGLLDPTIGGPSVFPPAPEFLFQPPASYGPKTWKQEAHSGRYRRGMYTFRFRSVPYPALETFDAPNGDFACVRRARSNTPLQALTTLNEPLFVQCAQALGLSTMRNGGSTDGERLEYGFRRVLARLPEAQERDLLLDVLSRQQQRFSQDDDLATQLAATDPAQPPELPAGTTITDLAAWTAISRILLNLDEAITKQ